MAPARRVRCQDCGLAKLEEEFSKSTVATAAKGAWSCLACTGGDVSVTPSRPSTASAIAPALRTVTTVAPAAVVAPPAAARLRDAPASAISVGPAVLDYINFVEAYVEKNVPSTCWPGQGLDLGPVTIPHIDRLRKYALNLDKVAKPASSRQMFDSLLGRASQVDFEYPIAPELAAFPFPGRPVPTTLTFPRDHHMHPSWGSEWYYVCAKLPIKDAQGNHGEAAILSSLQRVRAVGLTTQAKFNWSDPQSNIFNNIATVTLRFKNFFNQVTRTVYARTSLNTHWPATEPDAVHYSQPGEAFNLNIGPLGNNASFTSTQPATSPEILPAVFSLTDTVDGKSNVKTDLTFSSAPKVSKQQGWFYQGVPSDLANPIGSPGNGITMPPSPGIYYSWPQTVVTGTMLVVNGETFTITGPGNGWIDHQTMGSNIFNFDLSTPANPFPVQPIPFRQDSGPVNGWTWDFCNFADGTSWTGAAFEVGSPALAALTINPYGYTVSLGSDGKYVGAYGIGATTQTPSTWVTSPAGMPITTPPTPAIPFVSQYTVPNDRFFLEKTSKLVGTQATGWTDPNGAKLRADFNNSNYTSLAECPADWSLLGFHKGWGYLETVSYEPVYATQVRMMQYLDNSTYPKESPLVDDVRKK